MRVHLRWEAFNIDALGLALDAIGAGQVHLLAFNDHTPAILRKLDDPAALAKYSERAGVPAPAFRALAEETAARRAEVAPAQAQVAAAARAAGLPMASHDDDSAATRDGFRRHGARLCEFPMTEAVAQAAAAAGDWVAMGSPNVVRGGSHMGWGSAARMAEARVCGILTSDYYYPALRQAPFLLAARGGLDLRDAWALVSANPAAAAGLTDRGSLAEGKRADIVLMAGDGSRVVATLAHGRLAFSTAEAIERLS
jgi:alpha-D-ribose 1-methylphosphonate 5-triphosphate diphosphatase